MGAMRAMGVPGCDQSLATFRTETIEIMAHKYLRRDRIGLQSANGDLLLPPSAKGSIDLHQRLKLA